MLCHRCHTENREGRRFCSKCAAPLALVCPSCGFTNEPGDEFCGGCAQTLRAGTPTLTTLQSPQSYTPKHLAEKILTSKGALEGERKQVTVLFVDVSGFTSLSETLDPEDVHGLMTRAFELMLGAVHRYEGTVNQFLGDGIMALFGAPLTHEDHARRAVHAPLAAPHFDKSIAILQEVGAENELALAHEGYGRLRRRWRRAGEGR
jgi:class 3 adenylate cyclase